MQPTVAAVATQVNEPGRGPGTRDYTSRERKRKVESGRSIHVDGVQGRIGTHHAEGGVLWNQQNVRNVTALFLVEVAPLLRQFQRLTAGDVFQVDDGIGYTTLGTNDQPLQVCGLVGFRIADPQVLGDGKS